MKQIRKMIVGVAIMLLGINFSVHGGLYGNTIMVITGGILPIIGLLVVIFNNHDA